MKRSGWLVLACAMAAVPALQGCFPMAAVGLGTAVSAANDRRTSGTQIEDEGIELRASNRVSERWGDKVHINVSKSDIGGIQGQPPVVETPSKP